MYYGTYQGWRYSPLQQINTTNVKRLVVTWKFRTGLGAENFQVTPLVVDGVMYLTNQKNELFALNAETGTMLWRSTYFQIEFSPRGHTWGHAQHRGVAVARGKVLLATEDAHLVALDAKSGEVLWKTRAGDYEEGHGFTSPPLIVKDKAILGIVTGEKPTRRFIDAYDIETGKRLWRFYTVPGPGEPGHETWGGDSWRYGCGPAWLPGIYDAAPTLVYLGIGNPCPMFSGEERAGDNLYTNAIVALTPETGQLHWYVQVIPHDLWDDDATNELVLVDLAVHDKSVKALAFDAANGELVWSFRTGSGLRGSPISYAVGGKQYIAVPSGWGGVAARNFSYAFPALAHAPRGSTLFVFGLSEE